MTGLGTRHRARLALTYAMTLIEKACEVAYPLLIGIAIDGLLAGRNAALVPLIAVWSLHLARFIRRADQVVV